MEYRRGSKGSEVARIQTRLSELGLYRGPIDGDFGGGTESAVKAFQRRERLGPDGVVGPLTWGRLFAGQAIPEPELVSKPLGFRALALTGTFETSAPPPDCFAGVTGDFDDQGISFGALQWNLGQGSLQPLLRELARRHPDVIDEVFADHAAELGAMLDTDRDEQLAWARSIQDARHVLVEPWRGLFKALGRRPECQEVQTAAAAENFAQAVTWRRDFRLTSERAAALMFDIRVQNGSISPLVRAQILADFQHLDPGAGEVARLTIIANRRAEAAKPQWIEDVRRRKLTIATGSGDVHGRHYDLAGQFGIGMKPLA